MKNLILKSGQGKTTRLLAISEFKNAPIICATNDHKTEILSAARRMGYQIPEPLTATELMAGKAKSRGESFGDYLLDDSQDVLRLIVSGLAGGRLLCMTTNDDRSDVN